MSLSLIRVCCFFVGVEDFFIRIVLYDVVDDCIWFVVGIFVLD